MSYQIRPATLDDIPHLCQQRRRMFADMGHTDDSRLDLMSLRFANWVQPRLMNGTYSAWLATYDGNEVVAGGGVWLMDWIPHVIDSEAKPRAYILNVYTEVAHRRRGLARQLTERCLAFCRERNLTWVSLHSSVHGRALYEALGFQSTNEMRLPLDWREP